MAHRPDAPEQDPLLAEIRAIGARLRGERAARVDPEDPALKVLVDRALDHHKGCFTPEGEEEARQLATFALATHPDIEPVLERVRRQQASGVRLSHGEAELGEEARRAGGRRGS